MVIVNGDVPARVECGESAGGQLCERRVMWSSLTDRRQCLKCGIGNIVENVDDTMSET
jgi:hypothetical protein